MRFFGSTRLAAIGALALCMAFAMSSKSAFAAARFDVGVGVGVGVGPVYTAPVYTAPAPVYTAPVYTAPATAEGGHYETRAQSVLVAPATVERRWVEPVYETRYYAGRPQAVCVSEGGWRQFSTPARYETRYVQVWVPDSAPVVTYTTPGYYAAPGYYYAPRYSGSFLDFSYRSRR